MEFQVCRLSCIFTSFVCLFPSPSTVCLPPFCILGWPLLYLFIFHLFLSVYAHYILLPPTTIHLSPYHIHPSFLYPSNPYYLPCGQDALTCICLAWMSPRFWFKCPNYSCELWCPALGYVASALCLSYESWHGTTEPFTKARLRACSHEQFSPCTRPWKADGWYGKLATWKHYDLLWYFPVLPPVSYDTFLLGFLWISKLKSTLLFWHLVGYNERMNDVSKLNNYLMQHVFQYILNILNPTQQSGDKFNQLLGKGHFMKSSAQLV